jgi:transcriptional regulator with XRE-family HTH domain
MHRALKPTEQTWEEQMSDEERGRVERGNDDFASDDQGVDVARLVAERIRAERDYLGLNQEQVAKVLGIPRAAVSAIETGRRKVSSVELARLAALFGTTPDRLLGAELEGDPTDVQLYRATQALSDNDKAQVLRFAEFLRTVDQPPPDMISDEDQSQAQS